jgi:hypothetical protein
LAYLDDALEPSQAKLIGQKVAESETAQHLMTRIKQVTRRRRLTAPPPTGPSGSSDPNTVAEYLDNVLPTEQVAQVEQNCLESDVSLAEIAACHQILTLVLGEPVRVPPTARQRMYGLVKGREAIPYRKPPVQPEPDLLGQTGPDKSTWEEDEADEALLLGLPLYRRGGPLVRWAVPLGAICLLVASVFSLLMAVRPAVRTAPPVAPVGAEPIAAGPAAPAPEVKAPAPEVKQAQPEEKAAAKAEEKATPAEEKATKPEEKAAQPEEKAAKPEEKAAKPEEKAAPAEKPTAAGAVEPPSKERKPLGRYVTAAMAPPSILVQRAADGKPWERLRPNVDPVNGTDRLISLPGYRSELRLDSNVRMVLWGNLPEFSTIPVVESAVVLNANPGVDLDFTLERGRVLLSNLKADGPARVRVRFLDEVWEITLPDATSEVAVEHFGMISPSTREAGIEPPVQAMIVLTLAGQAHLKIRYQEFQLPSPTWFLWENVGPLPPGPRPLPRLPDWYTSTKAPATREARSLEVALGKLSKRLSTKAAVDVALAEALKDPEDATRTLAVRSLMALDNLTRVLDALDDEKHFDTRVQAIQSLRHWLGETAEHDKQLREVLTQQKRYTASQAETVLQLLHGFTERELADATLRSTLVEYLNHTRLPIRQLAHFTLYNLVPEGRKIRFDPAGETAQREAGADQWRKLLEGKGPAPKSAAPK